MFKTKSLKLYKSIGLQLMAKEIADVWNIYKSIWAHANYLCLMLKL